jgi:uncharacterized protein (TIGR02996 family)
VTTLADVLASPGDLAVRLAFAEALSERGDPRGELIRRQIALLGRLTPDQREEHARRCARLMADHGAAWSLPVEGWAEARFRAGFIAAIRTSGDELLRHGDALLTTEPVQEVTLTDASDETLAALAKRPMLARIRRLAVEGGHGDVGAAKLCASAYVAALGALSFTTVGEGFPKALAKSKLGALRVLGLTGCEIGDEGAAVLAKADRLAGLSRLYLARCAIGDEGVAAIAQSKKLAALTTLCLGGNEGIGDEGAITIATAKGHAMEKLVLLELCRTQVGDAGAEAIAASKKLVALRRLDLRQAQVGRAGREALGKRKGLRARC